MSSKTNIATLHHEQGYGCAQPVLAAFAGDYVSSEEQALKPATGFGSGMGGLCEVWGALTSAFRVPRSKYGRAECDGTNYRTKTETPYAPIHAFASRFKERNFGIYCGVLAGPDLNNPEQRERAKREGVLATTCSQCVQDVTELVAELLEVETP